MAERLEPRSYLSASFSGPTYFSGVNAVTGIAAADFNGDGLTDVVVAGTLPGDSTASVLGVYLKTSGGFGTPTVSPLSGSTGGVATGDFTGKGKQDIAVVDSSDNTLDVFLDDGAGDFSLAAGAALGGSGGDTAIASGDFNHDGKIDLAVADPVDNQVIILFSNGDGSFTVESRITVPDPQKIVVADFNGDGAADLAVLSGQSPGSIYVALNSGGGTFGVPAAYSFGTGMGTATDIAAADFNGDGRTDLVGVGSAAGGASGLAGVLLNQGSGTFGAANDLPLPGNPLAVVTGNFSGSGNDDIAAFNSSDGLDILPGAGDGSFGVDQSIFTAQFSTPGIQAVAADLNGDGLPDIALVSPVEGTFGALLNTSGGIASSVTPSLSGPLPAAPLVAGGKIKPISQTVTLTTSAAFKGSVTVDVQFSSTGTFDSNNATVATLTRNLNLKAGRSQKFVVTIKSLPSGLVGAYHLVAQLTDPSGATSTAASATTVSIVAPTIDLSGSIAATPASAKAGRKTTITFSVANGGTIAVNAPLPVDVMASTTGNIDSTAVTIDEFSRHVLIQPGKTIRLQAVVTMPTTAGSYYLIIELDPQNTLNDMNLSNNTFVSLRPILVS